MKSWTAHHCGILICTTPHLRAMMMITSFPRCCNLFLFPCCTPKGYNDEEFNSLLSWSSSFHSCTLKAKIRSWAPCHHSLLLCTTTHLMVAHDKKLSSLSSHSSFPYCTPHGYDDKDLNSFLLQTSSFHCYKPQGHDDEKPHHHGLLLSAFAHTRAMTRRNLAFCHRGFLSSTTHLRAVTRRSLVPCCHSLLLSIVDNLQQWW